MSVVPKEDNLVMSFAEATRVFNTDQSNPGSFVPGTGVASNAPAPVRGNSHEQYPVYLGEDSQQGPSHPRVQATRMGSRRSSGWDGHAMSTPFEVADGPAAVVPATLPSQQQIDSNPNQLVSIRNPNREEDIDGEDEYYTNYWFQTRSWMRIYFAEFLGTMILVVWGEGTQAQVVAARKEPGDYLSVAWGWGVGFMLAIYVSSGISGGHINPAVTIALALFRKFHWRKVPGYILAQLLGGFCGAGVIYGVYYVPLHSLDNFDAVLTTGPSALNPTIVSTFFSVFIGAALLMGAIAAFTDTGNNPATPGLTPLLLGLVMVGIASSFGYQTGFVLNPARDLGPRLFLWVTGSSGHELFIEQHAYGIWTPLVGTVTGAIFGILLYDLLIYNGRDSPINFNYSRRNRRRAKSNRALEHDAEKGARLSGSTVEASPHKM